MTRACTSTELAYLSSSGQASALKLAFPESHILFSAQVNGTPSSLDSVVEIAYHNVTLGAYTDILPMATVWIGTSAGLYDLGIARVRKSADATYIYVGETSDLHLSNNKYITVVDDFLPWIRNRRNKTIDPITLYMDWDISFSDQYTYPNPVVNMGPDAVIYEPNSVINSGHPASTTFDASNSFMPDGTSIASHSWGVIGSGLSFSGGSTDNPTISVTSTGTWKVYDLVTGTNGKTTKSWRTVTAFDKTHPPVGQFNLQAMPTGDLSNGGWSFTVRMYDQAAFTSVKDRQQVILFARDWYKNSSGVTTEISLGPITDRENIICEGWIDKQSMHFDPNGAYVDFTVQGMNYWLDQSTMFMLGIEDSDSASDDWHKIYHMKWDFGLFSVLYWQSTLCFISDYFQTGDTRPIPGISEQEGSLWGQLVSSAWNNLLAVLGCNRYGQLYAFIPPDLIPSASRSGIPVVMPVDKTDTELGRTDIDRITTTPVGFLSGMAVQYAWGSSGIGSAKIAYSPGAAYKHFGKTDNAPQIVVTGQSQLNGTTSLYIARENNEYPTVPIPLVQNNRFVDICPSQFVYLERDASDNPRGVEFASNVIPNKVTLTFDEKLGFLQCEIDGYAETFEDLVTTGVIPSVPPTPPTPPVPIPPYPPTPWPTIAPKTYTWIIYTPATGVVPGVTVPYPCVALKATYFIMGGTSATFNVEIRTGTDPTASGTPIFTSSLVASTTKQSSVIISTSAVPADCELMPVISGVVGSPAYLKITLFLL